MSSIIPISAFATKWPRFAWERDLLSISKVGHEPSTPPPENNPSNEAATQEATESVAVSKDARTIALIAHILGIFTSFVVPLIIYLIEKDEGAFIADQSKEALNFQITVIIA